MDAKNFLALASWCAIKGKIHKMEGVFSGEIPLRGSDFPCPIDITPASKFRMLLHTNPTRERGECLGTRAGASEDM